VLNSLTKLVAGIVIAGSLTALVWAQAAPQWKDQGESDIGLAAGNEKDPAKQLELLKKWEQQYPESALAGQRTLMVATALFNIVQATFSKTDAASLDTGAKAAQQILSNLGQYFAPANKPAAATDAQWADAKTSYELNAHLLLAQIATVKKDDAGAESEYKKILAINPQMATTSYQLGGVIIHEMAVTKQVDPARYSEALYDLARSISVTGPTALPPAGKTAAQNFLTKSYGNYHGSADGLDDLIKSTSASALPPAGFHIPSIVDIEAAKEKDHAAWAAAHPDLDFWENIKTALTTQGDAYFANLKDVAFPPATNGTTALPPMFKGTVVSMPNSKQLLVSVDNVPTGDAILKFEDNIKGDIPAGTTLEFKGVVDSFTKDPAYVLTLNIQEPKTDIVGLPDGVKFVPDAAAKPRAPGRGTKTTTKSTKKAPAQ
jgi:hypothetical protein